MSSLGLVILLGIMLNVPGRQCAVSRASVLDQVSLGGQRILNSGLTTADFDGDGLKEIVTAAQNGVLYVLRYDGASWSIYWSRELWVDINAAGVTNPTTDSRMDSTPVVADLDGNGSLEIVVSVGGDPFFHKNGAVIAYTYVGGSTGFTLASGWPQLSYDETGSGSGSSYPDGYTDGFFSTPALGDLDGDGDLEIVVEGFDRRIHAWHHTGAAVEGWPIDRDKCLLRGGWSSPALGDIDGDGLPEVIVGTDSPLWDCVGQPDYSKGTVWAINGDGSTVPGWPVETQQNVFSSPAIGDIDGDGWLDVVVGTGGYIPGAGHEVYAWDHNGHPLPGWPRPTAGIMTASPALGDLDGDGDLEVVIGCGRESDTGCTLLYAWHGNGESVNGFPMSPEVTLPWPSQDHGPLPYTPILADYDGDGQVEILVVVWTGSGVTIVEPDGVQNADKSHYTQHFLASAPVVDDVDNDGMVELLIGGADAAEYGMVYVWHEQGATDGRHPWPMFHHDVQRTGNVYFGDATPPQNPSVTSPTHTPGAWSNNNVVQMSWSGGSDDESGLRGYFYVWDTSPSTEPGWGSQFASFTLNSLASDPLTDGLEWYFHLRAVDLARNLATDTVHLGPFQIDTVPPISRVTAPPCDVLSATVSWQGWDDNSSIASYDIEGRDGTGGVWTAWMNGTTAVSGRYGIPGHTYYFRSRARDAAGNLEAVHASADAHTRVTRYGFSGVVRNTLEQPIFNALTEATPATSLVTRTGIDGRYLLCYDTPGTYALTASRSGFGSLPAMQHLSGTVESLDFYLPPADDVLVNGQFESGDLSGWLVSEPGVAIVTDTAHTGYHAAQLSSADGTMARSAALSQTVVLSETLHDPVLSLIYRIGGNGTLLLSNPAWVAVQGLTQTLTHTLPASATTWAHVWMDLSVLREQAVTVVLHLDSPPQGSGWLVVDEVSLGTVVPGVRRVHLPVVSRQY